MTTSRVNERRLRRRTGASTATKQSVEFTVKTFWGLMTVRGSFDRFDGSYEVGPDGTTIELTIDADSLDTGNATRDKHLRSTDFFDVDEHPQVRFRSTRVDEADDRDAARRRATSRWRAPPSRSSSLHRAACRRRARGRGDDGPSISGGSA